MDELCKYCECFCCQCNSGSVDYDYQDIWSEPAPDNVIYVDFVAKRRVA